MENPILGLVVVAVFAVVIWFAIAKYNRSREIVECGSCRNRMTRGAFQRRGGCPRCGSDLLTPTGEHADRDRRA